MFSVIKKLVLIFIRKVVTPIMEPTPQICKIKAIIETIVLLLTLALAITKLSFLCT